MNFQELEEKVEKALPFLGSTDDAHARARARVKGLEKKEKTIKAVGYLAAEGANVAERTAIVESSQEYKQWVEDYENAVYDEQILSNQRKRAELTIEVWRSMNASYKRGNV